MEIEGTVIHRNRMGPRSLITVEAEDGTRNVVEFTEQALPNYGSIRSVNLGDRIRVEGNLVHSQKGGDFVQATSFTLTGE